MIQCEFENGNVARPGLRHVCVGVILTRNGKVLLAKRAEKLLEGGKWAVIGGFLDRDETTEEGAKRELMEESGWEVGKLTLLGINDNLHRPGEDRQTVDFIYFGEATIKTGEPDWETAELKWFDFDDLPPKNEIAFDHLESILMYQRYLTQPFSIPVMYNR